MEIFLFIIPGFITYLLILSHDSGTPTIDTSEYILVPILSIYSVISLTVALVVTLLSRKVFADTYLDSIVMNTCIRSKLLGQINPVGLLCGFTTIYFLKNFTWPITSITKNQKKNLTLFLLEIYEKKKFLCMIRTKQGRVYVGNVSKREERRHADDFIFITPIFGGFYNESGLLDIKTLYVKIGGLGFKRDEDNIIETGIALAEISSITNFSMKAFVQFYKAGSVVISNNVFDEYMKKLQANLES